MPILGNPQHERFAQEFHRLVWTGGKPKDSRIAAYKSAGYETQDETYLAANARKLAQRKDVKARLAELSDYSSKLAGIDASWAMVKLKTLADSNLASYMTPIGGPRTLDLTNVKDADMALLIEIAHDEEYRNEGTADDPEMVRIRKMKLKRADPIAAIGLMAKIAGWLAPEKTEHSGGLTLESLVGQSYSAPVAPAVPSKEPVV